MPTGNRTCGDQLVSDADRDATAADIVIVEDHGLLAYTVATSLRARGLTVRTVDPADHAADEGGALVSILRLVLDHDPELVLLDLDLGDGRDATRLIGDITDMGSPVVMVTGVQDRVRLARCVDAGSVGIIDKGRSFDELLGAIDRVLADGTLLSKHEQDELLAALRTHDGEQRVRFAPFEDLSPREGFVLGELMRGRTVDQIASSAVVSVATVRTQVRAVLSKLDATSQIAAVSRARDAGWVPPQERADTA
jgi:two-component system, NarL family, nitrate/nitrite response regulator NarL